MIIQQLIISVVALMAGFFLMTLALYWVGYKKKPGHRIHPQKKRKKKSCGSCADCTCDSLPQN